MRGLVPELDQILSLERSGFRVNKVNDQGVAVSKFDQDTESIVIDSERTWLISYRADADQSKPPSTFHFASASVNGAEMTYQRYVNADLAKVGPEVSLEERYEQPRRTWIWWTGGGLLAVAFIGIAFVKLRTRTRAVVAQRYLMPEPVTPFTVLGLLREIQQNNGLPAPQMNELAGSIERVERHYFSESDGEPLDLHQVAETWIRRVS